MAVNTGPPPYAISLELALGPFRFIVVYDEARRDCGH